MNAPRPYSPRKEKTVALLQTGRELAHRCGVFEVSMDQVAREAGISKRTLYRHFHSRTEFLAAVIDHDGDAWQEWFFDAVIERAEKPAARLQAFFDVLCRWAASPDFEGCLFAQASWHRRSASDKVTAATRRQIEAIRLFLVENTRCAGSGLPDAVTAHMLPVVLSLLSGTARNLPEDALEHLRRLPEHYGLNPLE